ncbi:MAG: hypothetical protein KC609_00725, partial [Myxococcales bacterium]|nr:hypothetical protein [Myxococcales bacterium]
MREVLMQRWTARLLVVALALLFAACSGSARKRGRLCQDDSGCLGGELCLAGVCTTLATCSTNDQCVVGVCSGGYCWTDSCSAELPCSDSSTQCVDGYCVRTASENDTLLTPDGTAPGKDPTGTVGEHQEGKDPRGCDT